MTTEITSYTKRESQLHRGVIAYTDFVNLTLPNPICIIVNKFIKPSQSVIEFDASIWCVSGCTMQYSLVLARLLLFVRT